MLQSVVWQRNKLALSAGPHSIQTASCQAPWNTTVEKRVNVLITFVTTWCDNGSFTDTAVEVLLQHPVSGNEQIWSFINSFVFTYFNVSSKFCAQGVRRSWCWPREGDPALHRDLTRFRELLSWIIVRENLLFSFFFQIHSYSNVVLLFYSTVLLPRFQTSRFFSFEASSCPELTFTSTAPIWSLQYRWHTSHN